jgi:murE/murF fusion protein
VGTVSYRYGGKEYPAPYTTPTPQLLHKTFADMVEAGCTHGVLEVSSAALSMDRMAWVGFEVAAFTNLTQDHLDVHGGMDAYRDAKARLFADYLLPDGVAVVNIDDPVGEHMAGVARASAVLRVSTDPETPGHADADIRLLEADSSIAGITARFRTPRGELEVGSRSLIGHYNIANLGLAVGIAEALEIPHEAIVAGISAMSGVPGRVERVANDAGLDILVDYAHTPDALENVLAALRPLTERRLICVFGCGGDRDPGKRPKMGAAVTRLADLPVVTSDNPRTEEPQSIIDMILPAVPSPFFVDPDRRTAIRAAIAEATPGDIVLIAGKGHEDYQILGTEKIHFDDREEAAEAAGLRRSLSVADILEVTGGRLVRGDADTTVSRVIIDGRIAAPGDLYVAIRGERFDGHDFCAQALDAGARALLVADPVPDTVPDRGVVIACDDPRRGLGDVAGLVRARWSNPDDPERRRRLVAITGSAGKTTTKDLLVAALSAAGRVCSSAGSLNNETGVPLTLLGLRPFHDYAVVEMGMRAVGQISYLTRFARPDVGVVVNAGSAHVGVVGSIEAIARGKSEIFAGLPVGGCAVLPADDPRLTGYAEVAPRRITFGEGAADVRLTDYAADGADGSRVAFEIEGTEHRFRLPLVGRHNALNAACALAAAMAVGVDAAVAIAGLEKARPASMRGEIAEVAGRHILVDCYNANPASMAAAFATLGDLRGEGFAVAVLGDMLELGDEAPAAHHQTGKEAASAGFAVIALGEHRDQLVAGAREAGGDAVAVTDHDAAARAALERSQAGDWILVKASRGMRLEGVVEAMRQEAAS